MQRSHSLFTKIIRGVIILLTKVNSNLPKLVERDVQGLQGKGTGADSVKLEVTSVMSQFRKNTGRDLVAIDVGANLGDYSKELLNYENISKIYAFEPSKFTFESLNSRFQNEPRISRLNLALSASAGSATLWKNAEGSGLASLTQRNLEHFGINFDLTEEVQVETLDSWCLLNKVSPDLIKIDVEGHELDVLLGGEKILSTSSIVQFEFGGCNIDTRTYFQDFWKFFRTRNFEIFRITPKGLARIEEYSEQEECFRTTNYLALNLKSELISF